MIGFKRGLSAVVATVLILLITIVLVTILAQVVIPFARDNLQHSTECIPYENYYNFDTSFSYNCYSVVSGKYIYKISVKAASIADSQEEDADGFNLVVGSESSSKVVYVKKGTGGSCDVGGIKNLEDPCNSLSSLKIPNPGESQSYEYKSEEVLTSVQIGSLLSSGRACDASDSMKQMPACT